MKKSLLVAILLAPIAAFSQTKPQTNPAAQASVSPAAEDKAVRAVITQLFDGMRKSDTVMVRSAFVPAARLQTVFRNKQGEIAIRQEKVSAFVKAVGTPHKEVYDERIASMDVKIDGDMASVWTPYTFYLGQKINHCGVNNLTLVKTTKGWKIFTIIDTRRKEPCK